MAARPLSVPSLGPYILGSRLGVGGMAEVYVARRGHGEREERFALKRILPQLAKDPRFVAMFCDEARISSILRHPNIVKVVDFGEDAGELFMALEFVDGVSVARLLRAASARGVTIPPAMVLYVAMQVLQALVCAHEALDEDGRRLNIVHRDVSPGNVLLSRDGRVKLTDFGIVRSAFVERRTYPGELKGKLGYMSPEQVMGEELDPRSDIFTLGIILAELILVRPLFHGDNEIEILTRTHQAEITPLEQATGRLPSGFMAALRRALQARPEARHPSARAFLSALVDVARAELAPWGPSELSTWLEGLGIVATPETAQSGTRRITRDDPD